MSLDSFYRLLPDHTVEPCDFLGWATYWRNNERRLAEDRLGEEWVSTVFIGMGIGRDAGGPLVFETMVFDHGDPVLCWRASTYDKALQLHAAAVAEIQTQQAEAQAIADAAYMAAVTVKTESDPNQ